MGQNAAVSRFHVGVTLVIPIDRVADAVAALPDAEIVVGDEAQSAEEGEAEVRLHRLTESDSPRPCESLLFSEASRATTWLYRHGVLCRLAGWGCQESDD